MGGSGGGYWPSSGNNINELIKSTTDKAASEEYTKETNRYLNSLLQDINNRDVDQIRKHLNTIQSALEKEIGGNLQMLFGGSVKKNTYVNGLSDIDLLVVLNDSSLQYQSPEEVKDYFYKRLRERLPSTEIKKGDLAVTVSFSSGQEIQLLPAIKTSTGIKIAEPNKGQWSSIIKPDRFAEKLSMTNSDCGGRLIPVIKLYKAINGNLSSQYQLSGYHVESLAIEAFENYSGDNTYSGMLKHFCNYAKTAVLKPITDSTGQSIKVDEYLGAKNSIDRERASKALERLYNRMERADSLLSSEHWENLFDK